MRVSGEEEEKERKAGGGKHVACAQKTGESFSVPVQYQVWCKDEFAGVVDGPPDESDHQDLQPGALQQFDLIMKGELHKTYKGRMEQQSHTFVTMQPLKP